MGSEMQGQVQFKRAASNRSAILGLGLLGLPLSGTEVPQRASLLESPFYILKVDCSKAALSFQHYI
jgi:hypothetical protein